jgi:penicillin-binding protein 2
MAPFATACGFGQRTGIELPHEKGGLVPTPDWKRRRFGEPWVGGDNYNMSIGQGFNLVTPLQVTRFLAALLNGGTLYKPLLLADQEPEAQGALPMSETTRKLIVDAMVETVKSGTARRLQRRDAVMGGKTGTAQVIKLRLKDGDKRETTEEMAYEERDHAWLASFGEKDGRRYVAVCMVEHGGHGGAVAGPILASVYDYLFGEARR